MKEKEMSYKVTRTRITWTSTETTYLRRQWSEIFEVLEKNLEIYI